MDGLGERVNADLVCLGASSRGRLEKAVVGSVAAAVQAHSHRPVLLVKARPE